MGDSPPNPKQNVVFWSWKKGQDPEEGDTVDGEIVQHYSNKNVSDSDSDDVDLEEERGKLKKTQQRNRQRDYNVNISVGKDNHWWTVPTVVVEKVASVVQRPRSGSQREENSVGVGTSTRNLPSVKERTGTDSTHPGSRRRSSQQERWEIVRNKLRNSLDVPSELSPNARFGFSKGAFRQQRLPILWQPIWNCKSAGRLLLILAICTLPLALWLVFVENRAQEYRFTFGEECKNSRNYLRLIRNICVFCGGAFNPHCSKDIIIPEDMKTPVFLYYELIGFHQNHRKISRSYDNNQLLGNIFKTDTYEPVSPSEDCGKYSRDENGKIYFPCGQLANLMYSDDFSLVTSQGHVVPLRTHGIAHSMLKNLRFRNPSTVTAKNYEFKLPFRNNFVKPKDWTKEFWSNWWKEGGLENERFINWMTLSSLPHMRKLYAIIDEVPKCPSGVLCKGKYTMNIEYRYDVDEFKANKAFIIATTTYLGGQNYKLPLLVGIIGCIELVFGLILLQIDCMTKSTEHYNRRHSIVEKRRYSDEDKPRGKEEYISTDIGNVPPLNPLYLVAHPPIAIVVPVASIVNNFENVGRVPGPHNKSQTEGLITKPTVKKEMFTLFWKNLSPVESQVVYPDDYSDSEESNSELSESTVFYTTEEEESDGSDSASFISTKSILVSAAEESSPEKTENSFIGRNSSRRRR